MFFYDLDENDPRFFESGIFLWVWKDAHARSLKRMIRLDEFSSLLIPLTGEKGAFKVS